jgi:uncharacterized membrane protein
MRRLPSLDIVRGAVMILMAIDHVRVYAGVPAGGPDPAVFFTRWVTHFCAPVFVFLAGTAAYLYGQKIQSRAALAKFLVIRGLWLVLLELTVLRFAWTFNLDYANFTFAGVIWVIGWSMVVLAGPSHSADPPRRRADLARAHAAAHAVALRQPSDAPARRSAGISVESRAALPRDRARRHRALLPLPLVRARQSRTAAHLDEVRLRMRSQHAAPEG